MLNQAPGRTYDPSKFAQGNEKHYPLDISEFAPPRTKADEDDEQCVHNWLDSLARDYPHWVGLCKAMLARPAMPEKPSEEIVSLMVERWHSCVGKRLAAERAYAALYAHLTKPKTKAMWIVTSIGLASDTWTRDPVPLERALEIARDRAREGDVVTMTPHEVPAD